MNNTVKIALVALLCVGAAACSKKAVKPTAQMAPQDNSSAMSQGDSTAGKYKQGDLETDACLRQRVVYFDFNKEEIKPEFQQIVACHAKYLQDRPTSQMRLEGNTDERGTREYNLGLGERRGNAVSSALHGSHGYGSR